MAARDARRLRRNPPRQLPRSAGGQEGQLLDRGKARRPELQRAKRALHEAEEKLRLIKRWSMEFDHRVDPLVKQLESLRTMLGNVMPRAVAHLGQMVQTLDAYSGVAAPVADAAAPPPEQQTEAEQREKEET